LNDHDQTGVWSFPLRPGHRPGRGRPPRPDVLVWPLREEEPAEPSTVPFPAFAEPWEARGARQGTAPEAGRHARPGGPASDTAGGASSAPGGHGAAGERGDGPREGAGDEAGEGAGSVATGRTGDASGAAREAPDGGGSSARRRLPRPVRVILQIVAAVGLIAVFVGGRGYEEWQRYERLQPPPQITRVAGGQTATLENATWRLVRVGPLDDPPADTPPERAWLEIELLVTPADEAGARYVHSPPAFDLRDRAGRTWRAEVRKRPEELRPGRAGQFTLVSVVPAKVDAQVELVLWPKGRRGTGPALHFAR
jgi:hypothetical protein